jgi:FKBP-type peptidyl-prolyl cis-trans isomerase
MGRVLSILLLVIVIAFLLISNNQKPDIDRQIPEEIMLKFFDGMQTDPDGIKYRDVRLGTGRTPQLTDKVEVHYRGFFKDGRIFDSSYPLKKPAVFQVNAVIPGWTKSLMSMKEGAIREVLIPSELAYGKAGAGNLIPPDTDLCFRIEFIKIY